MTRETVVTASDHAIAAGHDVCIDELHLYTGCPRCGHAAVRAAARRERNSENAYAIMLWCVCAGVALNIAERAGARGLEALFDTVVLGTVWWGMASMAARRAREWLKEAR